MNFDNSQTKNLTDPFGHSILEKVLGLKRQFVQQTDRFRYVQKDTLLSIGTYNVHMWMDPFDNEGVRLEEQLDSVDRILQVIDEVRPDVLFLQEFAPSDFRFNGRLVRAGKAIPALQAMGYVKSVFCNIVPSWLESPVGNAIFIQARVLDADVCRNGLKICSGIAEEIRTLPKAKETSLVQGIHEGQQETRCFISVRLRLGNRVFILATTHLDIALESQRREQMKEIIRHLDKQVEIAEAETEYLREQNVINKDYPFAAPVVILGGDFNTVDSDDVEALRKDKDNYEKITTMLNQVNRPEVIKKKIFELDDKGKYNAKLTETRVPFYPEVVKDKELGVCAFLKENRFHGDATKNHLNKKKFDGEYRYLQLGKKEHLPLQHTNWNITKIDHIFVGQKIGDPMFDTDAVVHPEPASDHLLLVLYIKGEREPLPFLDEDKVVSSDENTRKEMGIPNSLASAIDSNAFTQETLAVDEETGLMYYYPQIYSVSKRLKKRQNQCILLAPMLLSKDFGAWNKPSYLPSGDAKIVQTPRRIRARPLGSEFRRNPSSPMYFPPPLGKYIETDRVEDALVYAIAVYNDEDIHSVVLFTRPYVSGYNQDAEGLLTTELFSSQKLSLFVLNLKFLVDYGLDVSVKSTRSLAQTCMSYLFDSEVFLDGRSAEWIVQDNYGLIRALTDFQQDATTVLQGFIPITPHRQEATSCTRHRIVGTTAGALAQMPQKSHRYTYLFPATFYIKGTLQRGPEVGDFSQMQKHYINYITEGAKIDEPAFSSGVIQDFLYDWDEQKGSVRPDIEALIRRTDDAFMYWFADSSMVYHGDDVYQVSSNGLQYLAATENSRYSLSFFDTTQSDVFQGVQEIWWSKFDNPLVLLLYFSIQYGDEHKIRFNRIDSHQETGRGDYFYRKIDFDRKKNQVLIEYLMGWIQMDYLQQQMVNHAKSSGLGKVIFNETPEFIANTEREITLKIPIHAVHYPRKGPQRNEYTIGSSWNNLVETEGLKVYVTSVYYVVPPLQRVVQTYEGYADCLEEATDLGLKDKVKKIHRKHIVRTKAAKDNNPPNRVSWSAFRFLTESETSSYHLEKLESKIASFFQTSQKQQWLPDFGERIPELISSIMNISLKEVAYHAMNNDKYGEALFQLLPFDIRKSMYIEFLKKDILRNLQDEVVNYYKLN